MPKAAQQVRGRAGLAARLSPGFAGRLCARPGGGVRPRVGARCLGRCPGQQLCWLWSSQMAGVTSDHRSSVDGRSGPFFKVSAFLDIGLPSDMAA